MLSSIFAPTSVGKGVSFVIPHGLSCEESTVFVDFKGEIATAVAEFRRRQFGHRIVLLDPFHVLLCVLALTVNQVVRPAPGTSAALYRTRLYFEFAARPESVMVCEPLASVIAPPS